MDLFELIITTTNSVLHCGCVSMNFQMHLRAYRTYCVMHFSQYDIHTDILSGTGWAELVLKICFVCITMIQKSCLHTFNKIKDACVS